jgi:periplasmic protein CpxP/Spy
MTNPSGRVVFLTVAVLLSLPSAALAQSAAGSSPASPAAPSANTPTSNPLQQRVEARIKQLHEQLRITPAEEQQWNQFAQTMRDNAREMDETALQRAQQFSTMTATQNMQSYEKLAEAHVQHLQKLIPAFQALYDAMPPEQRQLADQVFRANAQAHAQAQNAGNQGGGQGGRVRTTHVIVRHYRPNMRYTDRDWENYRSGAEELNYEELQRLGVLPH